MPATQNKISLFLKRDKFKISLCPFIKRLYRTALIVTDSPRAATMLRVMLFAVSLLSLFMPVAHAAVNAKNDSVAPKTAPDKHTGELANGKFVALLPLDNTSSIAGETIEFSWTKLDAAARYRLEFDEACGSAAPKMTILSNAVSRRVPSWELYSSSDLRWRVVALDQTGNVMAQTVWRILLSPSSECEN